MELDSLRVSLKGLAREDHINHQELSTVLQAEIKTRYVCTCTCSCRADFENEGNLALNIEQP